MRNSAIYDRISTEQPNPRSKNIDRVSVLKALQIVNQEDSSVPNAVWKERRNLEKAVRIIVASLEKKGRLFFIGAGTSGRLGVLEAAECPPTFNTSPSLVQAFMAGGRMSVFRSKEGAEDRGSDAASIIRKKVKAGDVVVGIAASGVTAYVHDGLKAARRHKVRTILVTCNPKAPKNLAEVTIAVNTGPEVITGSTRLKAGTATKLVLNSLTVVSMSRLGKVFGNRMVDLQPRSKKLQARALGLIKLLGGVSEKRAVELFKKSRGHAKTAIFMAKKKIGRDEAVRLLKISDGHLHRALSK